jgi:hypothetical protein
MKDLNRSFVLKQMRTALVASTLVAGTGFAAAITSPGTCSSGCDEETSDVNATILSNPEKVSLSQPGSTSLISYSINITHYANTEQLTGTVLTLTTSVTGSTTSSATFDSTALPSGCTLTNSTTLACLLPDTKFLNDPVANFSVTVIAPTAGTKVSLASTLSYSEEVSRTEVINFPAVDTALSDPASDPDFAGTFIPPAGGTFFTGTKNGLPSAAPNATWAASVKVPSNPHGVGGTIQNGINSDPACPRAANLLDCSSSEITVPGTFSNQLTFVLRRDASTIRGNGKIASAIVYYDHAADELSDSRITYSGYGFQVPSCSDTTYLLPPYAALPMPGIPCIQQRNAYFKFKNGDVKSVKDGQTGKDDGQNSGKLLYWEFIILAVDNGRFTN